MWPFSSYPVYSPSDVQGKTYDYVIVGGGTAGCVVAARLSEDPGASVLVIDKGHVRDNMVSRIPLVSQNMFLGDLLQVQGDRWTEPMPGANRRRNRLWAVEGIGGASRMNAMLWTRGYPGDYAAWSEMGLHEWSYEKLEPYFTKLENAIAHPGSKARGHEGPIEMRRVTFPFAWTEYFRKAAQELGLRTGKDINDPVEAPAMGFFDLDVAIDDRGNRISALTAYLNKEVVLQRRDRLTVCTGGVASRLEADAKTGIVTGVHIRSSDNTDGEFLVKARREVIICAGAACTPQLLLLSGIGPAASSEKHGIPLIKELSGVGSTLSDHYSTPIMLEVPKKETFHLLESLLGIWHFLLWLVFGKGYMSIGSMSSTMYLRSGAVNKTTMQIKDRDDAGRDNQDASLSRNVPDIEIMLMPNSAVEREVKGRTLMSIYPTLVQPRGSGRVELANTDALAQPRITYPMFTNEHDISTARLAVRFSMRLAEKLQNSDYPYPAKLVFAPGQDRAALEEWEKAAPVDYLPIPMPLPPSVQAHPSPKDAPKSKEAVSGEDGTWSTVTDDEIDDYMKRVSHTSLHFSGTCPMSNDEKTGVVDQQLRVYGFTNLRIADTSVFPKIPSCHTMAPVMAVAERCAELVKSAE
ncbi:choline dehydrogenase [Apiospora arundinis]